MSIFTHTTTSNSRERHTLLWLLAVVFTAAAIVLAATTAAAHGAPIIDGLYTGDWCAPAIVGVYGADTLGVLTPALCPLGSEIFWDDWDATNYGGPPPGVSDTMGWLFFGIPLLYLYIFSIWLILIFCIYLITRFSKATIQGNSSKRVA